MVRHSASCKRWVWKYEVIWIAIGCQKGSIFRSASYEAFGEIRVCNPNLGILTLDPFPTLPTWSKTNLLDHRESRFGNLDSRSCQWRSENLSTMCCPPLPPSLCHSGRAHCFPIVVSHCMHLKRLTQSTEPPHLFDSSLDRSRLPPIETQAATLKVICCLKQWLWVYRCLVCHFGSFNKANRKISVIQLACYCSEIIWLTDGTVN